MKRKSQEYTIPVSDRTVRQKAIVAEWYRTKCTLIGALDVLPIYHQEKYLTLGLGRYSTLTGRIIESTNDTWASIDYFEVSLKGHGIGARLLKAFIAESKDKGATVLWSNGVSNDALALRRKVFGDEALNFYDCQSPQYGFLPMTIEQVIASNERINQLDATDANRPNPQGHIGICVDLASIDSRDWERADVIETIE